MLALCLLTPAYLLPQPAPPRSATEPPPPPSTPTLRVLTLRLLVPAAAAGRGSDGAVHKARILASGDIVAVKIIPVTEADELASIQLEIGMLRDCSHPNIVKYYVRRARERGWVGRMDGWEGVVTGSAGVLPVGVLPLAAPLPAPLPLPPTTAKRRG